MQFPNDDTGQGSNSPFPGCTSSCVLINTSKIGSYCMFRAKVCLNEIQQEQKISKFFFKDSSSHPSFTNLRQVPPTPSPSIWRCLRLPKKIQRCIIIFPLFLLEKDGIPHPPNPKMMLLPIEIIKIALVSRSVFPSVDRPHPHPGL